jgi:hypothetical protein
VIRAVAGAANSRIRTRAVPARTRAAPLSARIRARAAPLSARIRARAAPRGARIRAGIFVAGIAAFAVAAPAQAESPNRLTHRIAAAVRGQPFFTEVLTPARQPRGVVITFHRGAWSATGAAAAATEHGDDHAWLRRGWIAVNSSYRPGVQGLDDAQSIFTRVRRVAGGQLPICLVGASPAATSRCWSPRVHPTSPASSPRPRLPTS